MHPNLNKYIFNQTDLQLDHQTLKAENKRKYFINKYVKPYIYEPTCIQVYRPSMSQPVLLFSTAKVHKPNCPFRSVIATYGTPEYNLAKYLNSYITPVISQTYTVNRNSQMIDKLFNYRFTGNSTFVSFDIVSFFTYVPLEEIIDITDKKVYSDDSPRKPPFL